jgi:hypothetical protein
MTDCIILIPFIILGIGVIFFLRSGIILWRNLAQENATLAEKIIYAPIVVLRIVGSAILLALLSFMIIRRVIEVLMRYF